MPLGPEDMQAAHGDYLLLLLFAYLPGLFKGLGIRLPVLLPLRHHLREKSWIASEEDIGPPSCHIGRDRDSLVSACLGHYFGFPFMDFRIQYMVRYPFPFQHLRKTLRLVDRKGADEHRFALRIQLLDLFHHGPELLFFRPVNDVGVIVPDERPVCGDDHNVQVIRLSEFHGLRIGRAGHARQLLVHSEIILERHGGEGLVLPLDLHVLFCLKGLVETVAEASAGHEPARKLVHDDDLPVFHDVIHVPAEQVVGLQGLVDMVEELHIFGIIEVVHLEDLFDARDALFGEISAFCLLVYLEIIVLFQLVDDSVDPVIFVRRFLGRTRNDKRCPGFIDKDTVHLVHDGVVELPLHELVEIVLHIISQIIEAEFVVRAVRRVTTVRFLSFRVIEAMDHHADGNIEKRIDGPHPFCVTTCQIVVHRDHVNAETGKGVEIHGKGCNEGLSLARRHFRYLPFMEHDAAYKLHVEMTHSQGPSRCLPDDREGFGQKGIQLFAIFQTFPEVWRHRLQFDI
ncbi:MAG: hypothetical protein A4E57_03202 [Syntrophorhabdaceae bacterium PtaU1.Bin034]|nr:MAG: hypothetical protein A4E57_03202 [Syntrophorhabdaceae bacterium PtaU1.Bin034]